jgi:hypothetical protein
VIRRPAVPRACALVCALASFACFMPRAAADGTASPLDTEARAARAQSSVSLGVMEGVARRARVILQTARRSGTQKEQACADEELSRVDMALRVGREHARRMLEDWEQGDAEGARRELAHLAIATRAARLAGAEAESCIDVDRPPDGTTVRFYVER